MFRDNVILKFEGYVLDTSTRLLTTPRSAKVLLTGSQQEILLDILEARGRVVLKGDFTPWKGQNPEVSHDDALKMQVAELRRKLGPRPGAKRRETIIVTIQEKGYALAPGISVEEAPRIDLSESEILDTIAQEHIKSHLGPEILAAIHNCRERIDRGNATAETYVTLALGCINAGHDGFCLMKWGEALSHAKNAISDALALDKRLSSALAIRGLIRFTEHAWQRSKDDLDEALSNNPEEPMAHLFYAHLLACQHDGDRAVFHVDLAVKLEPHDRMSVATQPWIYVLVGHPEKAIQKGLDALRHFHSFPPLGVVLGWAYQAAGHFPDAIAHYEAALDREFTPAGLASLGNACAQIGKIPMAKKKLQLLQSSIKEQKLIKYVSPFNRSVLLSGFGASSKSECLRALEQAFQQKAAWLPYVVADPRFDWLKHDKRFLTLVAQMGLKLRD